jgi:hypothetical protein
MTKKKEKVIENKEEKLSTNLKNDFKKYSNIIKTKSKNAYQKAKPKVIEMKKKTMPFLKKVYENLKKFIIFIYQQILILYSKVKPIVIKLFHKTKKKTIELKNNIKNKSKKTKEEKQEVIKVKEEKANKKEKKVIHDKSENSFLKFFTVKRVIVIAFLLLFLYFFYMPIYYKLFYGEDEVKLLKPSKNKFKYPKSTVVECPEGRICEGFFLNTYSVFDEKCPISCDDDDKCTKDYCDQTTGYKCVNEIIPNCSY